MTSTDVSVTAQPDLGFVYAIHRALTEDVSALVAAAENLSPADRADRIPTIERFFTAYTDQLVAHHTHEDEVFFPALVARVGREAMAFDELEAQHDGLHDAIDRVRVALRAAGDERTEFASARARSVAAVQNLADRLTEHLELEERACFPLYLTEIPVAEHAALEARVQAMGTFEQLTFMVPWLFDRLPDEIRAGVLAGLPEVFGTVYAEHVCDYRRLIRALQIR